MTPAERADQLRRLHRSQHAARRAALERAIAERITAIQRMRAQLLLEMIPHDPAWVTAARRARIELDAAQRRHGRQP